MHRLAMVHARGQPTNHQPMTTSRHR